MSVGEISEPIKTQYGWHIIEALTEEKAGVSTPLKSVRQSISDSLLGQKKSESVTKFLANLKKEYEEKITYATGLAPPETEPLPPAPPTPTG